MEEEALDRYKVEGSKRGAFKGTGDPLVWRKVRKNKRYEIRKECGEKTAGQSFSPSLVNTTCSVCRASRRSQQKRRR